MISICLNKNDFCLSRATTYFYFQYLGIEEWLKILVFQFWSCQWPCSGDQTFPGGGSPGGCDFGAEVPG